MFAVITALAPHLILLDEPTNHLDFVSIDALKDAIASFPGAVLLVSHDQSLMEVCDELWIMETRKSAKPPKLNPNQLKAAALKAQKQLEADARAAYTKTKKAESAAASASAIKSLSSSSSSAPAKEEKFVFQSRCALRKLGMTFEEYRASLFASF